MSDDRGQALVEFALGLPVFIAAALFAFVLLDAVATQQELSIAARRSMTVLIGSNDDSQAIGAATESGWLRGQPLGAIFEPSGAQLRCVGTAVSLTLSARGHLSFLRPISSSFTASDHGIIENEGPQAAVCAAQ